jgi:methylenetetrahydrofolate dehydrogenase (NADP+)/methenyltetrahydrofolate cyclohydrolase
MAILLRGKELAQRIKEDLKAQVVDLKARFSRPILLCAISVGEDSASLSYMRSQRKTAEFLGIDYKIEQLSEETTESELIDFIEALNQDSAISGIILQMPLPSSIDAKKVLEHINPLKDVEGVHPQNMGRLFLGDFRIVPLLLFLLLSLLSHLRSI